MRRAIRAGGQVLWLLALPIALAALLAWDAVNDLLRRDEGRPWEDPGDDI